MASLYKALIEKAGIEVTVAADPTEGIKLIQTLQPDLILLDIMLPHLSGYDVIKMLKDNPDTRHIMVVCFSALSLSEDIEKAKSLGADDYFVKSLISVSEVVSRLKSILNVADSTTPKI